MITHGWSPMGSRNYIEIARLTCAALTDYNCMVFDWTDGATGMNLNVIYFNMRVVGLYMSHLIQDQGSTHHLVRVGCPRDLKSGIRKNSQSQF